MDALLEDRYVMVSIGIAVLCVLISGGLLVAFLPDVHMPVILHWDVYQGVTMQGEARDVWLLLATALIILGINIFFIHYAYQRERFLSYLFSFFSAVVSLFVLMAISAIVHFN